MQSIELGSGSPRAGPGGYLFAQMFLLTAAVLKVPVSQSTAVSLRK